MPQEVIKIVDRTIEVPVDRIVYKDRFVEKPVIEEKIVEVPKYIEVPVTNTKIEVVDRIVEKFIEVEKYIYKTEKDSTCIKEANFA